jgi:hypothetical protein
VTSVDGLRAAYGRTWEISTELVCGVAAWRHANLPRTLFDGGLVNIICASDLNELSDKLAEQDGRQRELDRHTRPTSTMGRCLGHVPSR